MLVDQRSAKREIRAKYTRREKIEQNFRSWSRRCWQKTKTSKCPFSSMDNTTPWFPTTKFQQLAIIHQSRNSRGTKQIVWWRPIDAWKFISSEAWSFFFLSFISWTPPYLLYCILLLLNYDNYFTILMLLAKKLILERSVFHTSLPVKLLCSYNLCRWYSDT